MKSNGKKVFVGLSGGVDSSVSAYLLKKKGYDVTGVFIKVWQPDFVSCTWQDDRLDAMRVCAELEIPFKTLNLEDEYKKGVIDYLVEEYQNGRTPNPDIFCNKEIKFGAFLFWAKKQGADYIATGHYALNIFNPKISKFELKRGFDGDKDQTYFLWTLTQEVLRSVLFPVGHLIKPEVRRIANEANLPTATKKDSQGLCFISNLNMKDFLKHFILSKQGDVLNEKDETIGTHDGAQFFTPGERHGFMVNHKDLEIKPYYIVAKDIKKNTLKVSHNQNLLSDRSIIVRDTNFISGEKPITNGCFAQVRYHGNKEVVEISFENEVTVYFKNATLVSPGQSIVFYHEDVCIGGGIIV